MALLFRFAKCNDRANTHLFTFVATRSITRDLQRDVTTKEFSYGNQKWSVAFSRGKNSLGVFLLWKSTSESMRIYLDFSFTLFNRDHFSINEIFSQRNVSTLLIFKFLIFPRILYLSLLYMWICFIKITILRY